MRRMQGRGVEGPRQSDRSIGQWCRPGEKKGEGVAAWEGRGDIGGGDHMSVGRSMGAGSMVAQEVVWVCRPPQSR